MKIKNIFLHISSTLKHKGWVFLFMGRFALRIFIRGIKHDNSKFTISESKGFIQVIDKLPYLAYGSEEYKACLKQIKPSIQVHYKRNSHHIEHYPAYTDMSIYDLIEMICDWKAAIKRHKYPNANLEKSFAHNKERFKMSDEIVKTLKTI